MELCHICQGEISPNDLTSKCYVVPVCQDCIEIEGDKFRSILEYQDLDLLNNFLGDNYPVK